MLCGMSELGVERRQRSERKRRLPTNNQVQGNIHTLHPSRCGAADYFFPRRVFGFRGCIWVLAQPGPTKTDTECRIGTQTLWWGLVRWHRALQRSPSLTRLGLIWCCSVIALLPSGAGTILGQECLYTASMLPSHPKRPQRTRRLDFGKSPYPRSQPTSREQR